MIKQNIHQIRKQKGFSQQELAEKINVNKQTIVEWEKGTTNPDIEDLLKLSQTLEVSVDSLLKDDKSQFAFYPKEKVKDKAIETYKLVSLLVLLFSIFMIFTLIIISIFRPITFFDLEHGIEYYGFSAYWHLYIEVKIIVILFALASLVTFTLIVIPRQFLMSILMKKH